MDTEEFERLTPLVEAQATRLRDEDPEGWERAERMAGLLIESDLVEEFLQAIEGRH